MNIVDICKKYLSDYPDREISEITDIGGELVINATGKDGNPIYTHPIAVSKQTGEYRTFYTPREYEKLEKGTVIEMPIL